MGALPSRETHQRGLYSHRHGRNRRSEIILIPLTRTFFPSPHCALFEHLFRSRQRRTAKYYYRALRSADTSRESDYFCTSSKINEPEAFQQHCAEAPPPGCTNTADCYESYADTLEGLYQVLIAENECCLHDTDAELRAAYREQVREQRADWDAAMRVFRANPANAASDPTAAADGSAAAPLFENVPIDAFLAGYAAAKRYVKGKALHTHVSAGDGEDAATGTARRHVTSPSAFYIRPLPCAIASRYDANKPPPVDDPLYVPFQGGCYVKVLGMFGVFPATVPMRYRTPAATADGEPHQHFPRKEGHSNADEDMDDEHEIEQHLLKGTMFIDKDVGDQILGNVVMLATHMYVRHCVEAGIRPRYLPMAPVLLRAPLSNIPMLQFIREFRVRLRSLLEAGTARAGEKPVHTGLSGFNPEDIAEPHDRARLRAEEEGYLFEDDIPAITRDDELFELNAEAARAVLRGNTGTNTNPGGALPFHMMSGFNVQSTPLRHPALRETGHRAPPPANSGRPPYGSPTSLPSAGFAAAGRTPNEANEARKRALLVRRKNRFRFWIERGHLCVWASAAYARRACLLLAQQLNTTVDSNAVPDPRAWDFRGLLHAGAVVPPPLHVNDVLVVAEDIPAAGLWQGDVLRCSLPAEEEALLRGAALPLPTATLAPPAPPAPAAPPAAGGSSLAGAGSPAASSAAPPPSSSSPTYRFANEPGSPHDARGAARSPAEGGFSPLSDHALQSGLGFHNTSLHDEGAPSAPSPTTAAPGPATATPAAAPRTNFTSNHASNPLLREQRAAPAGAFWVRAAGGLDDAYTNVSAANMPPHPKVERQQQALLQRARGVAAPSPPAGRPPPASAALEIHRGEGTLNIEEVVLSWVKVVSIITRDATEEDEEWVRDPAGHPVRIDRYVIRRYEHDGIRYFIGVTPRFVGQQRRIEKVLGEVYAMESRAPAEEGGALSKRTILEAYAEVHNRPDITLSSDLDFGAFSGAPAGAPQFAAAPAPTATAAARAPAEATEDSTGAVDDVDRDELMRQFELDPLFLLED